MRCSIILFTALLTVISTIEAQVYTKDIPYGLKHTFGLKNTIPQLELGRIDIEKNIEEDKLSPSTPLAYCNYIDTLIDLKQVGNSVSMEDGNVWTYKIYTENATSINLYLNRFLLPEGAKLFVYEENSRQYLGAFTHKNQKSNRTLQIADLTGNELIIEYFEPTNVNFEGEIIIKSIGVGYRDINEVLSSDFIDVNCQDGNEWQLEKHGVCKITFKSDLKGYQCTGTLINTTSYDGTPYFLTANHCISEENEANTAIVYFNYEKSECEGTTVVATNQTVSGAQLTATSSKTDFTLLLLDETPPASYQPYYAGWSRYEDNINSAITIHHPSEMTKKIAIDNDPVTSYPFVLNWSATNKSPTNSHWQVKFDRGITISGSSGGPLLNEKGQIIGQLHGGDATSGVDFYGKLSESWDLNIVNSQRLKTWLDPLNTDSMEISGYFPDGIIPDAHFSTDLKSVCYNYPIEFKNYSVFDVQSYTWKVDPPYAHFVNGTDSSSTNPVIQFDSTATYTINLQAKNNFGINQQIFTDYIEAGNTIETKYNIDENSYCFYEFNDIEIEPSGAVNYYWLTDDIDEYISSTTDENSHLYLSLTNDLDSTYLATIKLIGEQGVCVDTAEIQLNIIYPSNDNIINSTFLDFGVNGPFYNYCATTETNEPTPLIGDDCDGKNFWCDDYGSGTLVIENTTWFSFLAPQNGNVTIKTSGINSQIAIYEADKAEDIISGNLNKYSIVAANDDYSTTTNNAQIDSVNLTPGKRYWLQFDGYQGDEGSFFIELIDNLGTDINTYKLQENELLFYPNPSKDGIFKIMFTNEQQYQRFQVYIYNLNGKLIGEDILIPFTESINLSKLSNGLYVIKLISEKNIYQTRIAIIR